MLKLNNLILSSLTAFIYMCLTATLLQLYLYLRTFLIFLNRLMIELK